MSDSYYNDFYHVETSSDGTETYTSPVYGDSYSTSGVYTYTDSYGDTHSSDGTTSYYNSTYNDTHFSDGSVSYTDTNGITHKSEVYKSSSSSSSTYDYSSYTPSSSSSSSYSSSKPSSSYSSSSSSYSSSSQYGVYHKTSPVLKTIIITIIILIVIGVPIGVTVYCISINSIQFNLEQSEFGSVELSKTKTLANHEVFFKNIQPNEGYYYAYGIAEAEKFTRDQIFFDTKLKSTVSSKIIPVFLPEAEKNSPTVTFGKTDTTYNGGNYFYGYDENYSNGWENYQVKNLQTYLTGLANGKKNVQITANIQIAEEDVENGELARKLTNSKQMIYFSRDEGNKKPLIYSFKFDHGGDAIDKDFSNEEETITIPLSSLSDDIEIYFIINRSFVNGGDTFAWYYKNFTMKFEFVD